MKKNSIKKEELSKPKNKINIFSIIGTTIKVCVLTFMIMFALIICMQRFSNNSLSIFNYRLFSVVTGSMSPKYEIGDVLLCKEVDVNTLKVGDDITYLGKSGTFKNKIVTHRIHNIEETDGELKFYTKGIASTRIDPVVKKDQIYGKIVIKFEILSWLYKFITTPSGFYICIFIPIAILIGSEIISTSVEKYEEKMINKKKR